MDNKKALLVFGGNSFEHDISIITALTIYNRAKACEHELLPLYLSKNNEWFLFLGKELSIQLFKNFNESYIRNHFVKAYFKGDSFVYYKKGILEKKIGIKAAINCCHGGIGENGTLTAFFNKNNIPVSSGNVLSQSIGMDKVISKYVFSEMNLPVIKYFKFTKREYEENKEYVLKKLSRLDYPVILKPSSLGSSIGIEIARDEESFIKSAEVALEFDDVILVEKAILDNLREFNVACMRYKNEILVSEIDEPKRKDEILSFHDKYIGEEPVGSKHIHTKTCNKSGAYNNIKLKEVDLTEKQKERLKEFALKIYKELDFVGPVRVDFIMDKKNKIYVNEINTIPGSLAYFFFIPTYFKSMNEYVDALVNEAIKYDSEKNKIKKEFITKLI